MGNFGKRLLIILISVIAIVAFTLVGNAYQQSERKHNISNKNEIVLENLTYDFGEYSVKYNITKDDVWKAIIDSRPLTSILQMVDKKLLEPVISSVTQEEINSKLEYLIYGTNNQDEIQKIKDDAEKDQKVNNDFYRRLAILGYAQDGPEGSNLNDYLKLQVAYEKYGRSLLVDGKTISGKTYDVSYEAALSKAKSNYKDTIAISIKFYSATEAIEFMKNYNLVTVSDELRFYVGGEKYKVKTNEDGISLDNDLNPIFLKQTVTHSDDSTSEEFVPNANLASEIDDEGKVSYIYNSTYNAWQSNYSTENDKLYLVRWNETTNKWQWYAKEIYTPELDDEGHTVKDAEGNIIYETTVIDDADLGEGDFFDDVSMIDFENQNDFTTSNTVKLGAEQFFTLYVKAYNDYYKNQRNEINVNITVDDFKNGYGANYSDELFNSDLKKYGYVYLNNEIRKYVGNEEYLVEIEEVEGVRQAKSVDGIPSYVFNESSASNVPNYVIRYDSNNNPILDCDYDYIYLLNPDGSRIKNLDSVPIEECTSFTLENTIPISKQQQFLLYVSIFSNDETVLGDTLSHLVYNYDKVSATRSEFSESLFKTLEIDSSTKYAYLTCPQTLTTNETDPYYLIFKLSSSVIDNPTEEMVNEEMKKMIKDYLKADGFLDACMAELRKEAGFQIFDKFFSFSYNDLLKYNSSTNPYGVQTENLGEYFKTKAYSNTKLVQTTKKVKVLDKEVDKILIKAEDLYEYIEKHNIATYITQAATKKIFFSMREYEVIHGDDPNYLTSSNWKMKEYNSATQYYNQYFEYYRQYYSQFGYDYYNSIEEFLYNYSARSFDDIVDSLKQNAMRNAFLSRALSSNITEESDFDLSDYGKSVTIQSDYFQKLYDEYFSINLSHILLYVDLDEDNVPDNWNEFYEKVVDGTTPLKKDDGTPLTEADLNDLLDTIYKNYLKKIFDDQTLSSTNAQILKTIVTEFNDSNVLDDENKYQIYKKLGIRLKYEALGEVTNKTVKNYVDEFQAAVKELKDKLYNSDSSLLTYSIYDGLCETEYGMHFIACVSGDSFERPSFKFSDDAHIYNSSSINNEDAISTKQIGLYFARYFYSNLFGSTDNPKERAGYDYPSMPTELINKIEKVYGDYLQSLDDKNGSYHSSLLIIKSLISNNTEYNDAFLKLESLYNDSVFVNGN